MGANPITVYAIWEKEEYTITLNANGGKDGTKTSIQVPFEDNIKDALDKLQDDEKPTREGYTFIGWSRNPQGTANDIITVNEIMEAASLTLYAVWEKEEYEVTLDANDGVAGTKTSIKVAFDESIKAGLDSLTGNELPTRTGYKLIGWSTTRDKSDLITDNKMGANPITVYAIWEKEEYTITLNANGGKDGNTTSIKVPFDDKIIDSLNLLTGDALPTKEGHKLIGWATNPDGSGLITDANKMGTSPMTLYAVWKKVEYTINLDANGGTAGTKSELELAFDEKIKDALDLLRADELPTRDGYKLIGWATNPDGSGLITENDKLGTSIKTLYAVWEKAEYTITLNANGGTDGTKTSIEVTFDESIKAGLDLLTGDELPTRDGYKFVGWSTNKDGSGLITDTDRMGTSPIKLYAVWDKAPEITVVGDTAIKVNDIFNELDGVDASDLEDGSLKGSIKVIENTVDVKNPGKYKVVYEVTDKAGNVTRVEREVIVYGQPIITGATDITLDAGSKFDPLAGVVAKDTEGKEVTISVSGDIVDVTKPGKYTVTYTVTDEAGNVTTVDRIVIIKETTNSSGSDNSVGTEEEEKTEENGAIKPNAPNTGDKGMFPYLLLAISSMLGLAKTKKGKKE